MNFQQCEWPSPIHVGFVARIKDGLRNVTGNDIGPINDQEMDAL